MTLDYSIIKDLITTVIGVENIPVIDFSLSGSVGILTKCDNYVTVLMSFQLIWLQGLQLF